MPSYFWAAPKPGVEARRRSPAQKSSIEEPRVDPMNTLPALSFALLVPFAWQNASVQTTPQDKGGHAQKAADKAGALFAKNCSKCHFLPDAKEPTDLAWLSQVTETS